MYTYVHLPILHRATNTNCQHFVNEFVAYAKANANTSDEPGTPLSMQQVVNSVLTGIVLVLFGCWVSSNQERVMERRITSVIFPILNGDMMNTEFTMSNIKTLEDLPLLSLKTDADFPLFLTAGGLFLEVVVASVNKTYVDPDKVLEILWQGIISSPEAVQPLAPLYDMSVGAKLRVNTWNLLQVVICWPCMVSQL